MRRGGRYKAADLRHQGNQRILAHVRRFTGHVRAGDEQHPVLVLVEHRIVGYKQTALEHLFNDRVAALLDLHNAALIHVWHDVVVLQRRFGKACQHIELCHSRCRALDADDLGGDRRKQVGKQLVFQNQQALVCAEDLIFQLLQFGRDVALARRQRLLAGEGIGHRVGVGAADLDIVAEHLVEADLQLGDAGLLAVACLKV